MITRIVKLSIDSHKVERFIQIFESIEDDILKFAGCKDLNLLYDAERPNILYTISKWATENHLNDYRSSGFFEGNWKEVKTLFIDKPQAWTLKEVR